MKIEQYAPLKAIVTTFEFGEAALCYSQDIPSMAKGVSYDIDYEDIPKETKTIKVPNRRFLQLVRYGRIAFISVVAFFLFSQLSHQNQNIGEILLIPAVLLVIAGMAARKQHIAMIEIQTKRGKVQIIKDGQERKILEEIENHRKNRIIDLYGEIDFSNDPDAEIRKFEWLRDSDYITAEQAENAIKEIEERRCNPSGKHDNDEKPTHH